MDNHKSILSIDIQTGHNAILMNGSTISADPSKLVYASTEYPGSYIILGDFNGKLMKLKYLFKTSIKVFEPGGEIILTPLNQFLIQRENHRG